MVLSEEEKKMIEALHKMRQYNYVRYHGFVEALTAAFNSEIQEYCKSQRLEGKIIQFPNIDQTKE